MKVYIVTAYRWGDQEKHSYVVGAYSSPIRAARARALEEQYRGGKYTCEVIEAIIDRCGEGSRPGRTRRVQGIPKLKRAKSFDRFLSRFLSQNSQ